MSKSSFLILMLMTFSIAELLSQEAKDQYYGIYTCSVSNCNRNQFGQMNCKNNQATLHLKKTADASQIEVFFDDLSHFILSPENDSTYTHPNSPYISALFYSADSIKLTRVHSSIGYSTYKGRKNGPLMADAGQDQIVCYPDKPLEARTQLGGNPTASGGVAPYTYSWSGKIPIRYNEDSTDWILASAFLDDTTKSNPTFKSTDTPDEFVTYYLTVKDAAGNIEEDSVRIINSFYLMGGPYFLPPTIHKGDSVRLYGTGYITNTFMPLQYSLSPSHGLRDSTDLRGWAKPDTSITYYLYVINPVGCVLKKEYWRVKVIPPVGVENEIANDLSRCYFSRGDLIVHLSQKYTTPFEMTIATTGGTIVHREKYSNRHTRLSGLKTRTNQLYIVSIDNGKEKKVFKVLGQ